MLVQVLLQVLSGTLLVRLPVLTTPMPPCCPPCPAEDPRERDYLKTILHRIYGAPRCALCLWASGCGSRSAFWQQDTLALHFLCRIVRLSALLAVPA